jgi:endonuclease YncB( thermonuclease family)
MKLIAQILLVLAVATSNGSTAHAQTVIEGYATAHDGDDLIIEGTRVRLHGIDAFERSQTCTRDDGTKWPCGEEAKRVLGELVTGKGVRCVRVQWTRSNGRPVMHCHADALDLNEEMVRRGLALDCPRYSKGRHKAIEEEAKKNRQGMWSGSFVAPWVSKGKRYCCSLRYLRDFC